LPVILYCTYAHHKTTTYLMKCKNSLAQLMQHTVVFVMFCKQVTTETFWRLPNTLAVPAEFRTPPTNVYAWKQKSTTHKFQHPWVIVTKTKYTYMVVDKVESCFRCRECTASQSIRKIGIIGWQKRICALLLVNVHYFLLLWQNEPQTPVLVVALLFSNGSCIQS